MIRLKEERKAVGLDAGGFSLPELLVAMVIGVIVITALVTTYQRFAASVTEQSVLADLQLSGRSASEFMVRELRMAGFTPGPKPTNDDDEHYFGIKEAHSSKVRFTWDQFDQSLFPDDAGIGQVENDKEEIITYYFDASDGSIKRQLNEGTVNMSRQPLLGGLNSQLRVRNLSFSYLDANDAVLVNPNTKRSQIKSIVITIAAEAPAGRRGVVERSFVTRVRCRNLGLK